MSKRQLSLLNRYISHAFFYIFILILTTGCKEDISNPNPPSANAVGKTLADEQRQVSVSGVAMKGRIVNGIVTIYSLEQKGGYYSVSDHSLGKARTDHTGSYKLQVTLPQESPGIVVRVGVDPFTTMICDVPSGCKGIYSEKVSFGKPFGLKPDFEMFASHRANNKTIKVNITPLTHLAYKWAEAQSAGLSPDNITASQSHIEALFDLPENTLAKTPIDLTALGDASYNPDQIQYGLLSASFQALANSTSWNSIVEVLDSASLRLAETGTITGVNLGAFPEVTRSDLFHATQSIATELVTSLTITSAPQTARVAYNQSSRRSEVIEHLRRLASYYGNSTTQLLIASMNREPLRITFQPSSATVTEQEPLTLNVNALGSGPIRYQWRKDGQPIPQATSEHLVLSAPTPQDSGSYDCVVSNDDGSIVSKTAIVEVKPRKAPVLVWEPPKIRLDGSPLHLSELRGYRILYGLNRQQLDQKVEINDPYTTQFELSGLQGSTYFFAIQAIDELDNESSLSDVIKVTL